MSDFVNLDWVASCFENDTVRTLPEAGRSLAAKAIRNAEKQIKDQEKVIIELKYDLKVHYDQKG